jgi:hypothetical protein
VIRVRIATTERHLEDCDGIWFEQIDRRRQDGLPICIRVMIETGLLNMTLSTGGCPSSNVRGRQPNTAEAKIFSLWERLGLNKDDFSARRLIEFLGQVSD